MPGAYAHITLVNEFRDPRRLERIDGFPVEVIASLLDHFKYCELGAVSPDYPYLAFADEDSIKWADAMHRSGTGAAIRYGVEKVGSIAGEERRKALVWLLGFASHVVMDVTIHPVVNTLVAGPYEQNKRAHRVCEMHQDAYIFARLDLGPIGVSEHLDSGILSCSDPANKVNMDPAVARLWDEMLKAAYPGLYASCTPDMDRWHQWFEIAVDKIAEEGNRLLPISRHVMVTAGVTYPAPHAVDHDKYIKGLMTPNGPLDYDAIFERAMENVGHTWNAIARATEKEDRSLLAGIGDWSLDTGRDENRRFVFWG